MEAKITTTVYEIKKGRKWSKVRATSMKALAQWANLNGVSDFRSVGMMSRLEILESQNLTIVI